jgi:hypothetical protein
MQHCPRCTSERLHFSRTKSKWEEWRKELTGKRPYRCRDCHWRGWAPDSGPRFSRDQIESASRALAPDPPNLKETPLARATRWPQEVDLFKLDQAIPARQDAASQD